MNRIVIVGAGQAGAQAAISLRASGYDGEVVLIGEEAHPPYQRPPLSKAHLKGRDAPDRLYLRTEAFYEQKGITLRLGERVTAIDPDARSVSVGDERLAYDELLLATGAPPRHLAVAGGECGNVHYLRTHADAERLRTLLAGDGAVVVVGAGYIGLEVASVLRGAGREVVVVEMAPRVLARVASEPVSAFYQSLHEEAGVAFRFGEQLSAFVCNADGVTAARLSSGEIVECAAALVGIGAVPATGLADLAGIETSNGILVDEQGRTSAPHVWAAGDCTNFPSARYAKRLRLESVPNAIEQAKVVATNMAGGNAAYDPLPWFWSDQYDTKLQTVGLSEGSDHYVLRGEPSSGSFSVWYFGGDVLLAVDAINDPVAFVSGQKLLQNGKPVDPAVVADPDTNLRSLL
ncbi:FAD-dependent oxidoreductase [Parvularcula dongshanensis]|uniref:3-phenylpropionate/trans-cinnamate dioxygenase ferredoxin reductase subunit n=1 Tax=Parvularcula dongshanensis TaxID=1173995 RepID=A0A840I6Q6_9PROT|nr:3-phenylpropionate/trans-cinnamate dioxygenase ferredoxin reductase subunit [Parvularcula dongshanensis]